MKQAPRVHFVGKLLILLIRQQFLMLLQLKVLR